MNDNREKTVVKAVREAKVTPNSLVTLSNGVTLRTKRVPNMIFLDITRKFRAPKVPKFMNEDIGREEDNPNDPEYIEAYNQYQADIASSIVDTMLLLGTEFVSAPKDIDPPSGKKWSSKLKVLGIDSGDDESLAYLQWIKYYAAAEDTDINAIVAAVGRLSGVSEEDVADAVDQFRGDAA